MARRAGARIADITARHAILDVAPGTVTNVIVEATS
jgi:hypothetical protein